MKKEILILSAAAAVLAGCIPSNPKVVNTPKGPVTCEVIIEELVWWDRSISRPASMSEAEADAICRQIASDKGFDN